LQASRDDVHCRHEHERGQFLLHTRDRLGARGCDRVRVHGDRVHGDRAHGHGYAHVHYKPRRPCQSQAPMKMFSLVLVVPAVPVSAHLDLPHPTASSAEFDVSSRNRSHSPS